MDDVYVIASETDALNLLKQLIEGHKIDNAVVRFEGWPKFVIRIDGVNFQGTIPTRIMRPLLELQRQVNRLYAQTVYGDSLRRLTQEEKESLELVVRVGEGSSWFESLLDTAFGETLRRAVDKMDGNQVTAVLITFGVLLVSAWAYSSYLNNRLEEKELEQTIQLSELDKEKMDILARARSIFPQGETAALAVDPVREEFLRQLHPGDQLTVPAYDGGDPFSQDAVVSGAVAKELARSPRQVAQERLLEDEFLLRIADFSKPGVVRVELERGTDGFVFRADVPAGVLTTEQEAALRERSWERRRIQLKVLIKEIHGRYTCAKVVSVDGLEPAHRN